MAAMSDYLENKLVDHIFRGQNYSGPANTYVGLYNVGPADASGGTEVSGGSYARVDVGSTLLNWSGTQGATSNTASSGTSGTTSNNGSIVFPAPTADWGVITHFGLFDDPTAGNLLFYGELTIHKTVNNGDAAPTFAPTSLSIQLDN